MNRVIEVTRKNLIGKTKVQSPTRYNKRLRYSTMSTPYIDEDLFLNNDMLVIHVDVGAYNCVIAYEGVMHKIIELAKSAPKHNVIRKLVIRAMNEQIDEVKDVYVRCSCPDFRYRFAYFASVHKYIWGDTEKRPSKITNPIDSIGSTCKHLACVLSNKKWLVKASSAVNDYIHKNKDQLVVRYNIDESEFVTNLEQHDAAYKSNIRRIAQRLPSELSGIAGRLFTVDKIEEDLYNSLGKRGWYIRVDSDLGIPQSVYLSKSKISVENQPEEDDNVYEFDVLRAGNKLRLKWRQPK